MTYLRARYYDSGIRRFISEDTYWNVDNMINGDNDNSIPDISAIIQSSNLYVYGMNNPIMFIDPSGNVAYEHFATEEQAVKDWVWDNYSTSYYRGRELASIIYQEKDENGNIYYAYTEHTRGYEHDVTIPDNLRGSEQIPYTAKTIATIHSHPNAQESFSAADRNYLQYNPYNVRTSYVAYGTPDNITIDKCEYNQEYDEFYTDNFDRGKYSVPLSEETIKKLKRRWL